MKNDAAILQRERRCRERIAVQVIEDRAAARREFIEGAGAGYVGREAAEERPPGAGQDLRGSRERRRVIGGCAVDRRLARCVRAAVERNRARETRAVCVQCGEAVVAAQVYRDVVA